MRTALIGHRYIFDKYLRARLYEVTKVQIEQGCKCFCVGTHGEFDEIALSVCRELRKLFPDIIIEVVLTSLCQIKPIITIDKIFGKDVFVPYQDVHTVMYDIEDKHYKQRIISSNQQMLDSCDTVICYVNEQKYRSGAKLALTYAKKKHLKIINLYNCEIK